MKIETLSLFIYFEVCSFFFKCIFYFFPSHIFSVASWCGWSSFCWKKKEKKRSHFQVPFCTLFVKSGTFHVTLKDECHTVLFTVSSLFFSLILSFSDSQTHTHPLSASFSCCLFSSLSLSHLRARTHSCTDTQMESPVWLGDLPCLKCLTLSRPTEAGCVMAPAVLSVFLPDVPCGVW